jgi:hypothetical protein
MHAHTSENRSVSQARVTHVSSNWFQVTDCDPEPSTSISMRNIEHKAIIPSNSDWTIEPVQYFHPFFYMGL